MPRLVAIERMQTDLSKPLWVAVYLSTIERYKLREYGSSECKITLADLGIVENQDDPAEGKLLKSVIVIVNCELMNFTSRCGFIN